MGSKEDWWLKNTLPLPACYQRQSAGDTAMRTGLAGWPQMRGGISEEVCYRDEIIKKKTVTILTEIYTPSLLLHSNGTAHRFNLLVKFTPPPLHPPSLEFYLIS